MRLGISRTGIDKVTLHLLESEFVKSRLRKRRMYSSEPCQPFFIKTLRRLLTNTKRNPLLSISSVEKQTRWQALLEQANSRTLCTVLRRNLTFNGILTARTIGFGLELETPSLGQSLQDKDRPLMVCGLLWPWREKVYLDFVEPGIKLKRDIIMSMTFLCHRCCLGLKKKVGVI